MTHLLPCGGVPRVHGARSCVPPRLPLLTTPRSVHHLAAVAAGAYPPRRLPNAWSPGVPAPPGPCYWLVASGTPVGLRGGCLAVGFVLGAVRHYCLGRCSALVVCARRSRPVRGGWGRCRALCLPRLPLPTPRFPRCVWRAVLSGFPLSSLAGTPFHAVCVFRGLGPVALLVFPACPLCVRALALSRRPRPPPLPGSVCRAHLAWSRCWAPVGPFHAVRAPPRVLPRSCAPFGLSGGGGRPGWGCVPPLGRACAARAGGRGGGRPVRLTSVRPSAYPGQATNRASSASLWPWGAWPPYCSGSCSRVVPRRGPCGVVVRRLGLACLSWLPWEQAVWGVEACGVRALLRPPPWRRGPSGGRGDAPSALGGVRCRRPCGPRAGGGEWGERGGGVAPWFPISLPRGGGPWPPARTPPCILVRPGSWGSPGRRARPAAGGSAWRGGGGAACVPSSPEVWPGGLVGRWVALPRSVPLPSLGRQQSGCHWHHSGYGGRGPHTAPVRVRVSSPGVIRAPSSCTGAGSLACRSTRGSRRSGTWGRVACGLSCVPPPGSRGPFGGRGDVPSA